VRAPARCRPPRSLFAIPAAGPFSWACSAIPSTGSMHDDIWRLTSPAPAGVPARDDVIDRPVAALRARQAGGPFRNREISTIARGLFAGIDIDAVLTELAPDAQKQMRSGRAAKRRRARGDFVTLILHRPTRIADRDRNKLDSCAAPRSSSRSTATCGCPSCAIS